MTIIRNTLSVILELWGGQQDICKGYEAIVSL